MGLWGECTVRCPGLDGCLWLMRKGAARTVDDAAQGECWRWVSPNARFMRSLLPAIFAKSLWYVWSFADVVSNLRSLVWGLGIAALGGSLGLEGAVSASGHASVD